MASCSTWEGIIFLFYGVHLSSYYNNYTAVMYVMEALSGQPLTG